MVEACDSLYMVYSYSYILTNRNMITSKHTNKHIINIDTFIKASIHFTSTQNPAVT